MIVAVGIYYTGITKLRRRGWVLVEAPNMTEADILAVMWFKAQHIEMPRNRVRLSGSYVHQRDLPNWGVDPNRPKPYLIEDRPLVYIRGSTGRRRWRRINRKDVLTRKFDNNGEPL